MHYGHGQAVGVNFVCLSTFTGRCIMKSVPVHEH